MALSEKQKIYAEYLLKRIGFDTDKDVSNYLSIVEFTYARYICESETVYKNGYPWQTWRYRYDTSQCISQLAQEVTLKRNAGSIKLKDTQNILNISATDLANYNFCPVSYSINKSFEIDQPTNEDKRILGINLHEKIRLIKKGGKTDIIDKYLSSNVLENESIKKIRNCKPIFIGHSEKTLFINAEKKYIGQPDYIFQDPAGIYFAVEEKFRFKSSYNQDEGQKNKKYFYDNHIVQLQSYIDYIPEYNIEYGILIYWLYDIFGDEPYIHDVKLKIIRRNEYSSLLSKTYQDIRSLINEKETSFSNVNHLKCVSCVVSNYCSHKTKKYSSVKIPYNRYDMRLKDIAFPVELRKNETDDQQ